MLTVVVGGGPVGCLAALYMSTKHNHTVTILERQPTLSPSNRSINLALSHRGLRALREVDGELCRKVLEASVPVRGRMIHGGGGDVGREWVHEYGCFGECIYSIDRHLLNRLLLEKASEHCSVRFGQKVTKVELVRDDVVVTFLASPDMPLESPDMPLESPDKPDTIKCDLVIGCDGVHSVTRRTIDPAATAALSAIRYKEIEIPRGRPLSPQYLHIWPHPPDHMFMALPNRDGTLTATFFTTVSGGGDAITVDDVITEYKHMLHIVHIDEMLAEWTINPMSPIYTIKGAFKWHREGKVVIVGDAAHGMLPFYGQGLNAGFEDVRLLSEAFSDNVSLDRFLDRQKADTSAMQALSERNWAEMNGGELQWFYNVKRGVVRHLHKHVPCIVTPLYTMLAFTDVPYDRAVLIDTIHGHIVWSAIIGTFTFIGCIIYGVMAR